MTTQERIAAATIAQVFGNDLLTAQQSARTDSGAIPQFVKVHPKSILQGDQTPSQVVGPTVIEQQRMTEMLQREAEASFPLPEQPASFAQQTKTEPTYTVGLASSTVSQAPVVQSLGDNVALERIAKSLENIAQFLQSYTISLKGKRVSRPRKKKTNEF